MSRRLLHMALVAGMSCGEAMDASPGLIFDLYRMRQKHDDQLHGIKRRSAFAREEG